MRIKIVCLLMVIAGTASISQLAFGGEPAITVFVGLDMPLATDVYEKEYNAGFNVGFQFRYPIEGVIALATEFAYSRFGDELTDFDSLAEDLDRLRFSGGILLGSNQEHEVKPQVKVLAGLYHHSFDRDKTDIAPPPPIMPTVVTVEQGTKFGLNLGGGVQIRQGKTFGLYLGADLDMIFQSENLADLTVKGGVVFPIR